MDASDSLRILVIDDNLGIHGDFKKTLSFNSESDKALSDLDQELFGDQNELSVSLPQFEIDSAMQGEEGVRLVKEAVEQAKPYAIVFVDIRMPPGLDGVQTVKEILKSDGKVQVVICTAYSDYSWDDFLHELGVQENVLILKKPFDSIVVRQMAISLSKKWQRDHLR